MSKKYTPQASVPDNLRQLRACMSCSLIKTFEQFIKEGCDNCPHLSMKGDKAQVEENTTTSFDGMISLADPQGSWVARWQGITNCVKGVYAISVLGKKPDDKE